MQKHIVNFSTIAKEALGISYTLFKIIIPIIIGTQILTDLGLTKQLGQWLRPVMEIVGLPGDLGLVWATAMLTNLYAGMIVFSTIGPALDLTIAQVTTLCTMRVSCPQPTGGTANRPTVRATISSLWQFYDLLAPLF